MLIWIEFNRNETGPRQDPPLVTPPSTRVLKPAAETLVECKGPDTRCNIACNIARNVAGVEASSTSATFHATIAPCVHPTARNVARNVASCVRSLSKLSR